MNKGILSGITPGTWRRYQPTAKCVGGATDPVFDTAGSVAHPSGQWLFEPPDTIVAIVGFDYVGNFNVGSSGPYAFRLPYPARRLAGSGNVDPTPIGNGMVYLSFTPAPNVNIRVTPTLANPAPTLDDPDSYFQAYCPYIMDWGTITTNNNPTRTTTHTAGFTFVPSDIDFTWTAAAANAWYPQVLTGIVDTSFTISSANGVSNIPADTANWKIRAEPPAGASGALLSPFVPWEWASKVTALGPFGNIFFRLKYRARR